MKFVDRDTLEGLSQEQEEEKIVASKNGGLNVIDPRNFEEKSFECTNSYSPDVSPNLVKTDKAIYLVDAVDIDTYEIKNMNNGETIERWKNYSERIPKGFEGSQWVCATDDEVFHLESYTEVEGYRPVDTETIEEKRIIGNKGTEIEIDAWNGPLISIKNQIHHYENAGHSRKIFSLQDQQLLIDLDDLHHKGIDQGYSLRAVEEYEGDLILGLDQLMPAGNKDFEYAVYHTGSEEILAEREGALWDIVVANGVPYEVSHVKEEGGREVVFSFASDGNERIAELDTDHGMFPSAISASKEELEAIEERLSG